MRHLASDDHGKCRNYHKYIEKFFPNYVLLTIYFVLILEENDCTLVSGLVCIIHTLAWISLYKIILYYDVLRVLKLMLSKRQASERD